MQGGARWAPGEVARVGKAERRVWACAQRGSAAGCEASRTKLKGR